MRLLVAAAAAAFACGAGVAAAAPRQPPYQHFRSRPDLKPPPVRILTRAQGTAPGYVFLAPKKKVAQAGPLIVDNRGQVVWFHPLDTHGVANLRVQRYRGRPVLTWWRGSSKAGHGVGGYVIVDSSYRLLRVLNAGNGLAGDIHEFLITSRNTALITVYHRLARDLRPLGGPKHGFILEGVVQELDIATGRVLFEWHSLPAIPVSESYTRPGTAGKGNAGAPYDYFHLNSIAVDTDGNLLISARYTSAVYKLRRSDGKVLWRLGGKRSDFAMGPGARFAFQHDVRRRPDGTLTLFDNAAYGSYRPRMHLQSRVLVLRLDAKRRRATLVRAYARPRPLLSPSQANAQFLPDGHVFVGWGSNPVFTEFDRDGRVLFEGRFIDGSDSYRAYRFTWVGRPRTRPAVAFSRATLTAYVSWNGATEVARWQVLAGLDRKRLRPVAVARKAGFETAVRVATQARYLAVRALDRAGNVLGVSEVTDGGTTAR